MKSSLILLLLLVAATCVVSFEKRVTTFVRDILYQPYRSLLTPLDEFNDQHLYVVAMYPAGAVSYNAMSRRLVFPFAARVAAIPLAQMRTDHHAVTFPLRHGRPPSRANPLSIWVTTLHRSSRDILQDAELIVRQFKYEQGGADPGVVIIYSNFSPSDQFTQELVALKNRLNVPNRATLILAYSVPFEHETANSAILVAAGFHVFHISFNNNNNNNNQKQKPDTKTKGIQQ